ncbi:MAG: leucine-rich repeat domain-containing protein [Muribaculaceae bacterium]|nr:leucine-rich repeat domain-containing protein [Muribaculaceae bacterium]
MAAAFSLCSVFAACTSDAAAPGGNTFPESPDLPALTSGYIMLNGVMQPVDDNLLNALEQEINQPKTKAKDVMVSSYGMLESAVGNDAMTIDSLTVVGPVDATDIAFMKRCINEGSLRSVNLRDARIKDNSFPSKAFYTESSQTNSAVMAPLLRIVLPENLVEIGEGSFAYTMLNEISLPSSLRRLGANGFLGNVLFGGKIVIPEGVETIPYGCFRTGSDEPMSFDLPNTLLSIGDYAFDKSAIVSVVIPGSTKTIGKSAFYESISENLVIEEGVERIDEMAFFGCSFRTLVLPSSVRYIGPYSFGLLSELEGIYCLSDTPPVAVALTEYSGYTQQSHAFSSEICDCIGCSTPRTTPVYVPAGSKERYESAPGWSEWFMNFVEISDMPSL